jgi:Pentapeptide repeats (8 copies)
MRRIQQTRLLVLTAYFTLAVFIGFAALILVPVWLNPPLSQAALRSVHVGSERITLQQAQGQLQNDTRTTLLQALAGIVVVAGAAATWRQVRISREGQITDRLTHAIDQVGSDIVDVRVGGIYALERLARDSADDRLAVEEILATFIRTHAPWPAGHESHPDPHPTPDVDEAIPWLTDRAPDVRTALRALGRLPHDAHDFPLALRRVDLRRTNFYYGTLIRIDFGDSNLAASWAPGVRWELCRLINTDLRQTRLSRATLDGSDFTKAHLEGATLEKASLVRACLRDANLRDADLTDSNLTGADLRGADLSGADLSGAQMTGVQTDPATTWPKGFTP